MKRFRKKPSKFEKFIAKKTGKDPMNVMMSFAVVLAVGLSVLIFFVLPSFLTGLLSNVIQSKWLLNLSEGLIRIIIFLIYLFAVSFMKEIKRVFMYHGAEHKVINCYEHGEEMTVENAQKFKTLHPRCGTSYMFFVVLIPILLFSLLDFTDLWYVKLGIRLVLLPVVAGLAFELLKFLAKHDNIIFKILRYPGMMLQHITTKQPTDEMVEVALVAFAMAQGEMSEEEEEQLRIKFSRNKTEDEGKTEVKNNIE